MLYGAPKQSGLLAGDLRSNARQAADRDRLIAGDAGASAAAGRDPVPATVRHSVLATIRQHMSRRAAAHAGAR